MKLRIQNGQAEPVSLFKFVFVGHALGVTMIFLPFFLLAAGISLFIPMETAEGGEMVFWMAPIMIPAIALGQGLMIGGVVTLGLWLYTRKYKITVEEIK